MNPGQRGFYQDWQKQTKHRHYYDEITLCNVWICILCIAMHQIWWYHIMQCGDDCFCIPELARSAAQDCIQSNLRHICQSTQYFGISMKMSDIYFCDEFAEEIQLHENVVFTSTCEIKIRKKIRVVLSISWGDWLLCMCVWGTVRIFCSSFFMANTFCQLVNYPKTLELVVRCIQ